MGSSLRNHRTRAFALPTVLIASVVLLTVLAVSVTATAAVRTTLKNQYYAQLAQVAGEAGVAYAKACLAENGNVPLWTDSKPLTPATDCSGNVILSPNIKVLVVAGGGGGSSGGGGAGGVTYNDTFTVTAQLYPVNVGNGGTGCASNATGTCTSGQNSVFDSITSIGGGRGGRNDSVSSPGAGGSGGGAGASGSIDTPGGSGTAGQGYAGGTLIAPYHASPYPTGGGGGAGAAGSPPTGASVSGNGGVGLLSNISGGNVYYGGGGGGATWGGGTHGTGGSGGGGNAGSNGTAGTANTGGGGGGAVSGGTGGGGGSGIVVVSYPANSGIDATGGTITNSGGNKIHKFTTPGATNFDVDSAGTASCPTDPSCSVTLNGNIRSSFSVPKPTVDSDGKALTIANSGYVQILRTSNGSVWRTYTQPSVQAAVVPDLCSGDATSARGWNAAVKATNQDSLNVASTAQTITLANSSLNAGQMYFRKDFTVTSKGTYNLDILTASTKDQADAYIDNQYVVRSSGSLARDNITLNPGCHIFMVKLTNQTTAPRATKFTAALIKSGSKSPVAVTNTTWRVAAGDATHYSTAGFYADPAVWNAALDYTTPSFPENTAARGISTTTDYAAGNYPSASYMYFRDGKTIDLDTATDVRVGYVCNDTCTLYLDGENISTGNTSIVTYVTKTLSAGKHQFALQLYNVSGTSYFYLTAFRTSDNLVLTQSDTTWQSANAWTAADLDLYSYEGNYYPYPIGVPTPTVKALVVGGGGGGGTGMGGGGGGGGVIYDAAYKIPVGPISVTVGGGGSGTPAGAGVAKGSYGGDSVFGTLRAFGGGGGGSNYTANTAPPGSGGSGGGVAGHAQVTISQGVFGQGYKGSASGGTYYPGGGGGAGGAGSTNPAHGGVGVASSILCLPNCSTNLYWGGGGGGSGYTGIGGNGGNGGGGGGAIGATTGGSGLNAGSPGGGGAIVTVANKPGGSAGANTGGGGGGGSHQNATNAGGNGGSGIVIISYPTGSITATGGTITTSGGNTIHAFYSSGTFTVVSVP